MAYYHMDGDSIFYSFKNTTEMYSVVSGELAGSFCGCAVIDISRDKKLIALFDKYGREILVYERESCIQIQKISIGEKSFCSGAFSPNGMKLALLFDSGRVWEVNLQSFERLVFEKYMYIVNCEAQIAYTDGESMIVIDSSGDVHLLNSEIGFVNTLSAYCKYPQTVKAEVGRVLVGCEDGIYLIDLQSSAVRRIYECSGEAVIYQLGFEGKLASVLLGIWNAEFCKCKIMAGLLPLEGKSVPLSRLTVLKNAELGQGVAASFDSEKKIFEIAVADKVIRAFPLKKRYTLVFRPLPFSLRESEEDQ